MESEENDRGEVSEQIFGSEENREDTQDYGVKINEIWEEIERMREEYDRRFENLEEKLSEYESYFERLDKYEREFETIKSTLFTMQENMSNIQKLLENLSSEQPQAVSDLEEVSEPSEESTAETFSSQIYQPTETSIPQALKQEDATTKKYFEKFDEYINSCASEISREVNNIKKRAMRNIVLLEMLRDYKKLNLDSTTLQDRLNEKLESYEKIPSYEPEDIKKKIEARINREELSKYDETKLKEAIENVKTQIIGEIVRKDMSDKLEIKYEDIVEIFVDYLEKVNKKKRSELSRAFDLLPDTRLLGFILDTYSSVKENLKKGKVDVNTVAEKVKAWYRITNPSNFKEELRKDIQPAAEYLILLLQTGRKEIEEHWSNIKRKANAYGIDIYPLVSPHYSNQNTFIDTVLSYKSEKIWGNERIGTLPSF